MIRSDSLRDPTRSSNFFSLSLSPSAEGKLIWSWNSWKIFGNFSQPKKKKIITSGVSFLKKKNLPALCRMIVGALEWSLGWSGGGLQRGGGVFQGAGLWGGGAEVGAKCGWLATLHREPWTAAAGLGTSCWSPYRSIPCWTVCPTRRWRSWFWERATSGKPVRDVWRIYSAGKWSLMSCRD